MREVSNDSFATVNLVCRYWRQTVIGAKDLDALTPTIADPNQEFMKRPRRVAGSDFEMMRVLHKGRAGEVFLIRHKPTSDLFALKAISTRHCSMNLVGTQTEQAVLRRTAVEGKNPFVVKLWWSLHDQRYLFLVMDFHPGGNLATQLARWGRFGHNRVLFYAAEIVEGVEGLHKSGIVYRDLQPENVLIGADGHIVLTDFGHSKELSRRSDISIDLPNVIPGTETADTPYSTTEYLAPEAIQGHPHGFEVDWWSFGTMLYEMLTGTVQTLSSPLRKRHPLTTPYRPPSRLTRTSTCI